MWPKKKQKQKKDRKGTDQYREREKYRNRTAAVRDVNVPVLFQVYIFFLPFSSADCVDVSYVVLYYGWLMYL